jgi:hypothetical protein
MLVLSQSDLEEFEELSANYKLFLAKNPLLIPHLCESALSSHHLITQSMHRIKEMAKNCLRR